MDRPLGAEEQARLRAISPRAHITATSFRNEYHWGDLKADPLKLLATFFDGYAYQVNWGTRTVAFRVPRRLLREEDVAPCCADPVFTAVTHGWHVILEWTVFSNDGYWDDGGHDPYDEVEPPVPPGLAPLNGGGLPR